MTILQAIFLGIVQGLTEFLPISSSGHLSLFEQFLGLKEGTLVFDIVIHVATLLAVFIYFRHQLKSFFTHKLSHVIIGTIPAVIFGFWFYRYGQNLFNDFYFLGVGFLVTSLLLFLDYLNHKPGKELKDLSLKQSFLIGVFQAAAIIPSLSRSGSTIVGGRFVGLNKNAAFNFSFLLSVPAIIAAMALAAKDLNQLDGNFVPVIAGFSAALISGLLGLKLLDYLFKRENLLPFAFYTLILGSALLGLVY